MNSFKLSTATKEERSEMKQKYIHYISYTGKGFIGVAEIYSPWKVINTKTKLNDCIKIISERNKLGPESKLLISNILTVKNK